MGVFSSRIWTALLALTLYFLRTRSLCFVLKLRPVFALIGWGVPAIIAGVLLSTVGAETSSQTVKADPNFQYGRTQAIVALILLTASFLVTVTSLILQQRYGKRYSDYQTVHVDEESDANGESANTESTVVVRDIEDQAMIFNRRRDVSVSNEASATECPDNPNDDETRFLLTGPTSEFCNFQNCDSQQQQDCAKVVERYRALRHTSVPEEVAVTPDSDEDEYQNLRHVVLLLILSCSMFVGIAICLWTIIMEQPSGIYLELLFLDGVLNYGQGFFVCMVFGFDTKLIVAPIMKKWQNFRQGAQSLVLPRWDVLDPETKHICEQFLSYHIDKCMRDLVRDRRWRLKWYRSVFLGTELVDWLILVGLAHDRSQGLRYGRHLLAGRLIRHIGNEYHFHDQPFFYTFLPSET